MGLWFTQPRECNACNRDIGSNPKTGRLATHNAGDKNGDKQGAVALQPIDAKDRCPGSNR